MHQDSFAQRGGQKVLAARLPRTRVAVRAEPEPRPRLDQAGEFAVVRPRPAQRVDQRERGAVMLAATHGISELGQIRLEPRRKRPRERFQRGGPGTVGTKREFGVEREQPAPAIGPLEPARHRPVEIGDFPRHAIRHQHPVGKRLYCGGGGHIGE